MQLSDGDPAVTSSLIGMMDRQLSHLVRLVDDLLETSRINQGTLELRKERVDLTTIVSNAVETTDHLVKRARHRLDVLLPQAPLWLDGDPVRLAQILANLLRLSETLHLRCGCRHLRSKPEAMARFDFFECPTGAHSPISNCARCGACRRWVREENRWRAC